MNTEIEAEAAQISKAPAIPKEYIDLMEEDRPKITKLKGKIVDQQKPTQSVWETWEKKC